MKKLLFTVLLFAPALVNAQNLLNIPDTLTGTSFNLHIKDTAHEFYSGFTTNTMGVNASYLGPTLIINKGDSIAINVFNDLMGETTIHWHGLHVSPVNDGGPHSVIQPSTVWSPSFVVRNNAATYWYHPHLHMMTNMHATMGAAGLIMVRDADETALSLPRKYGVDDFPLVLQSKCFDNSKQIVVGNHSDSVSMVNGTIDPFLPVPAQVIRLRLLNASSDRNYRLGFNNNMTFYQIASDGGMLDASVALTRITLSPGERAEILVDLSSFNGQTLQLVNYGSEIPNGMYGSNQPGMGAGLTANLIGYSANVLNGNNFNFLELQVGAATANPVTSIISFLTTNTPPSLASVNQNRTLTFTSTNNIVGPFLINNTAFNMSVFNYSIPLNNTEVWTLSNQSPIAHPFHIHDVQFYVTDMNGNLPPVNMQGPKDVILVMPMQTVTFITKFETFCNDTMPYMYHCHMLPHEDAGMMGQFVVNCATNDVDEMFEEQELFYPNPASSEIQMLTDKNFIELSIFSIDGKLLHQSFGNLKGEKLDVSFLNNGCYLLQVAYENKIVSKRIIIEK